MEIYVIKCRYFLELSQYLHICFWWFISLIYRRLKWKRNNFVIPMCRMWWNCQIMTQVLNTPTHSHTRPHSSGADLKWILLSLPHQHRIVLGSPAAISIFILKIWTPSTSLIFWAAASLMQREWCEMERDGPFGKTTPPPATRRDAMFQLGSSSHSPAHGIMGGRFRD